MIDEFLLSILACPRCDERPPVELKVKYLVCTTCHWGYPIVDNIPHMLPEDAVSPEDMETNNA